MIKILVADDSMFMRKILTGILNNAGYNKIIEAASGIEAIKKFKSDKPDLVLLDIIMEGKDGIETLKTIRAMSKTAKIIMVTAVGQDLIINEAKNAGCSAYIVKPFDEKDVIDIVKKILSN